MKDKRNNWMLWLGGFFTGAGLMGLLFTTGIL